MSVSTAKCWTKLDYDRTYMSFSGLGNCEDAKYLHCYLSFLKRLKLSFAITNSNPLFDNTIVSTLR
jgi:hypothetical protein